MSFNNYNCFIAGLPELAAEDRKLSLSVTEFKDEACDYIKGDDLNLIDSFFLPNDNLQVLRLLQKQPIIQDLKTVYPSSVLEDEVLDPDNNIPTYLADFIRYFKDEQMPYEGVSYENTLSWMYYSYLKSSSNAFVASYSEFFMNLKNLQVALVCRKYGKNIQTEIIGDGDFSEALRSSNAKDFGLSSDYPYVEKTVSLFDNDNLVERERGLDMLIWDFIDDAVVFDYFSIEKVLSFMLKLMIVERWSKMNSESGRKVFMEMVEKFRSNFHLVGEETK